MKAFLFLVVLISTLTAKSQLTLSAEGGALYTDLKQVKNEMPGSFQNPKAKVGQYIGVRFEHSIGKRFSVYHGLELQQKHFSFQRSYVDYFFEGDYRPIYFSLPIGIQYKLMNRKLPVTLSAGVYWETGIGGKVNYKEWGWGSFKGKRDVGFNNDFNHWDGHDLARSGLGLKAGIGLQLSDKLSGELMYDYALQNMQPETTGDKLIVRYHTLRLGFKYQLKTY
jgi:opacity protein-like surface antigen